MFKFGTILTFLTALLFPTISTAEGLSHPSIRGNYYVCPNGKTLPKNFFRLPEYSNLKDLDYGVGWHAAFYEDQQRTIAKKISTITHAHSKVIVGKKAGEYDYETIERLKYKMLNEGINTPNAYESYSIKPIYKPSYGVEWEFLFKNSEGKTLKIKDKHKYRAELINSQGKTFTTKEDFYPVGFLYCTPNDITLKFVRDITLKDITNQYGELVPLPMMFWMFEIGFKSDLPKSQNEVEF